MSGQDATILICLSPFILTVLGTVIIAIYLITKRRSTTLSDQAATAGPNARSNDLEATQLTRTRARATAGPNARSNNLQGVVRGFRESRQPASGFSHPAMKDVIVWSFQLERHSETEERLDPIPVEMRGEYFSGFINEGNVVRLYENSWQGGMVRTKRVYNVTFKEEIKAHTPMREVMNIGVVILIIFFFLFILFILLTILSVSPPLVSPNELIFILYMIFGLFLGWAW